MDNCPSSDLERDTFKFVDAVDPTHQKVLIKENVVFFAISKCKPFDQCRMRDSIAAKDATIVLYSFVTFVF